ncbi:DNA polymerase III subunit delta [Flavihumibacter stibioxidans]|uniref:DNA polymerase III subunit delta n=1 Tax=Flavihumibacter stibioxidans TaxID=1834163 RepID=A0ABR7M3Y7_9BACT|nr:DNA polymerase III subunit delta [Flavihumibacter stibioxidans]MBC6489736.1 DNA polymerase III subunit delta [Flavihumibacter stibioxidans]
MSVEKILADWKNKQFKPVYWLEGEEDYYIDKLMQEAEHHLLTEAEAGFNLTVFYGREANWADIVNACMRYPMFSDRQVVLLKEAQQMKDLDKLESYIANPLKSTVFVVAHKEKKVDGRSKLSKLLKDKTELLQTKKMYDNQLPGWTEKLVASKGYQINQKALMLLVDHIGNDLSRIDNEIDKLLINLGTRKSITEDDIEKYIGVSKEFNVFELQDAIARKDLSKALRIINYFEGNPKAGPIQMVLPALYNFFSKVFQVFGAHSRDEKMIASSIGISPFFVKDYLACAQRYEYEGVERILLLLHEYNLRSIGINDGGTSDASLMKEMVVKMM